MAKGIFTIEASPKEMQRALINYTAATGKAFPDVVNRTTKNLAFRAVRPMPKGSRSAILAVESLPWWPKMIASIAPRGYTRDEARAISKRLIRDRARGIGFMKSGPLKLAREFGETKARPKKSLTKSLAKAQRARARRAIALFKITWESGRKKSDRGGKEKMARMAFAESEKFVVKDMIKFTEKVLRDQARKVKPK